MYRIKDWALHYENAESRKIKGARWLPLPNKHDGKGFRRLSRHERAAEVFAAWILILQVASKCPIRGELADENGPLTALDLEDVTGFPEAIFTLAFDALIQPKIGWMEEAPWISPAHRENALESPGTPGQAPGNSGTPGNEGIEGREGTEEKKENTPPLSPPPAVTPFDAEVSAVLRAYPKKRERAGGGFETVHVGDGDRQKVAEFMTNCRDYPLLEAVKQYAKGTTRPKNLAGFLANPTARETVLAASEAATARASPPAAPVEAPADPEYVRRMVEEARGRLGGGARSEPNGAARPERRLQDVGT